MLSDRAIRNAKPGTHHDRLGLYLRVYPASKTFIYRDRRGGRDQWITLGHYPTMTLAQARQEALERRQGAPQGQMTLQGAWDAYYKQLQKQYRRPEIARARMGTILPALGGRRLTSITRAEVSAELQKIVDRGAPVMANRVLSLVKAVWRYAVERGWLETSTVELLSRRSVGGRETPRKRTLGWDEIEAFLRLLRAPDHDLAPGTRWALYLCLLTGVRASEALEMAATGRLELEDTKNGRAHRIPPTPAVRAALRLAKPHPVPQDHRVLSKALRRAGQTFTPHDLRRTFASRLADLGVMPHVVEKLLNHQMEGVMAVYNRAEYWPERVAAQRLWGAKLREVRKKPPPE